MASAEQLRLLTDGGVGAWNRWRDSHPRIQPDLRDAVLVGAVLAQADLHDTDLAGADLRDTRLEKADLRGAILDGVSLKGAQLQGATLRGAALTDVDLGGAVGLAEEQFGGADLAGVKFPEGVGTFKEGLTRVEVTSQSLQQVLFSLLVACLYGWLTIAATTHAQLVTNAASTPLPIIGTQIPIAGFFVVAPFLLLCLYVYFHLYMQQLWELLAALPAVFPDGRPLDRKSYPRPLGGFMRLHCPRLRARRTTAVQLQAALFVLLAWWAAPLTLAAFLWSYLPRHDWGWAAAIMACLVASIAFGYLSYRKATTTLGGQRVDEDARGIQWHTATRVALGILAVVAFFGFKVAQSPNCFGRDDEGDSWKLRGVRAWQYIFCYPVAHLAGEDISRKAAGWSAKNSNGPLSDEQLAFVTGASMPYSDLQYAMAFQAFMVKANLYEANLSQAYLRQADLRAAQLQGAWLPGADLVWAWLHGANLRQANLQKARLRGAVLTGAFLSVFTNCNEGCLAPVILSHADLQGAWLIRADLKGADLGDARLQAADLTDAFLQGTCLRNAKLQNAKLIGAALSAASIPKICDKDPINVCALKAMASASACSQQRVAFPTGRTVNTVLTAADLAGANVAGADLTEADLRGTDLRKVTGLTQPQLNQACVDAKTLLPDHLSRPPETPGCQRWR
jgi:uncharacterized protein YjbI with pentapeptide repeats